MTRIDSYDAQLAVHEQRADILHYVCLGDSSSLAYKASEFGRDFRKVMIKTFQIVARHSEKENERESDEDHSLAAG
jgi:hypothetical protein